MLTETIGKMISSYKGKIKIRVSEHMLETNIARTRVVGDTAIIDLRKNTDSPLTNATIDHIKAHEISHLLAEQEGYNSIEHFEIIPVDGRVYTISSRLGRQNPRNDTELTQEMVECTKAMFQTGSNFVDHLIVNNILSLDYGIDVPRFYYDVPVKNIPLYLSILKDAEAFLKQLPPEFSKPEHPVGSYFKLIAGAHIIHTAEVYIYSTDTLRTLILAELSDISKKTLMSIIKVLNIGPDRTTLLSSSFREKTFPFDKYRKAKNDILDLFGRNEIFMIKDSFEQKENEQILKYGSSTLSEMEKALNNEDFTTKTEGIKDGLLEALNCFSVVSMISTEHHERTFELLEKVLSGIKKDIALQHALINRCQELGFMFAFFYLKDKFDL